MHYIFLNMDFWKENLGMGAKRIGGKLRGGKLFSEKSRGIKF